MAHNRLKKINGSVKTFNGIVSGDHLKIYRFALNGNQAQTILKAMRMMLVANQAVMNQGALPPPAKMARQTDIDALRDVLQQLEEQLSQQP